MEREYRELLYTEKGNKYIVNKNAVAPSNVFVHLSFQIRRITEDQGKIIHAAHQFHFYITVLNFRHKLHARVASLAYTSACRISPGFCKTLFLSHLHRSRNSNYILKLLQL